MFTIRTHVSSYIVLQLILNDGTYCIMLVMVLQVRNTSFVSVTYCISTVTALIISSLFINKLYMNKLHYYC